MLHLPQAAVSCVGHQDMTNHPCSRVPSVARLVDLEEVDVPVKIRLEVDRVENVGVRVAPWRPFNEEWPSS